MRRTSCLCVCSLFTLCVLSRSLALCFCRSGSDSARPGGHYAGHDSHSGLSRVSAERGRPGAAHQRTEDSPRGLLQASFFPVILNLTSNNYILSFSHVALATSFFSLNGTSVCGAASMLARQKLAFRLSCQGEWRGMRALCCHHPRVTCTKPCLRRTTQQLKLMPLAICGDL